MCTLKSFPFQIEHCVEWAREGFNEMFFVPFNDLKKYMDDPADFLKQIPNGIKARSLKRMVEIAENEPDFEICVKRAINKLNEMFNYNI